LTFYGLVYRIMQFYQGGKFMRILAGLISLIRGKEDGRLETSPDIKKEWKYGKGGREGRWAWYEAKTVAQLRNDGNGYRLFFEETRSGRRKEIYALKEYATLEEAIETLKNAEMVTQRKILANECGDVPVEDRARYLTNHFREPARHENHILTLVPEISAEALKAFAQDLPAGPDRNALLEAFNLGALTNEAGGQEGTAERLTLDTSPILSPM
jgi:hypothetical protein